MNISQAAEAVHLVVVGHLGSNSSSSSSSSRAGVCLETRRHNLPVVLMHSVRPITTKAVSSVNSLIPAIGNTGNKSIFGGTQPTTTAPTGFGNFGTNQQQTQPAQQQQQPSLFGGGTGTGLFGGGNQQQQQNPQQPANNPCRTFAERLYLC